MGHAISWPTNLFLNALTVALVFGGVAVGCQSAPPVNREATGIASTSIDISARLKQLNDAGTKALQAGRLAEAAARFGVMLQLDPDNSTALYNLACVAARQGKQAEAVNYLQRAVDAGFVDFDRIQLDPDLTVLRDYPPFEALMEQRTKYLGELAERRLRALRAQLGDGYRYHVDFTHRLIFATSRSQEVMETLIADLSAYAEAQWATLFDHRFEGFLTVVIPNEAFFRQIVPDTRIGGFYHPERRLLLSLDIGYTLIHEFTHALHFDDLNRQQIAHNIWFLEGLATCFENSTVIEGVPTPLPNERQFLAQHLLITGQLDSWHEMLPMDQTQFMERAPERYAQCRYLVAWLWEQGKLKPFYDRYCATAEADPSGITALEAVLEKPLAEAEAEWREWLAELAPFRGYTGPRGPVLGVQLIPVDAGLLIRSVVAGGPAQIAGIEPGDVLLGVNARRIFTIEMLVDELARYATGDIVHVRVQRGETEMHVPVSLASRGD